MKNSFILLSILTVWCGCNNIDSPIQAENSPNTETIKQPNTNSHSDSIQSTVPTGISDSLRNENKSLNIDRSTAHLEGVEVTESKITFNSAFEATLSATVKNNVEKTIVALEIEFHPGGILCKPFIFQRKVTLLSGKTVQIRQKIPKVENCSFTVGRVYINDFVFSDGSKQDGVEKYLQRLNRQEN